MKKKIIYIVLLIVILLVVYILNIHGGNNEKNKYIINNTGSEKKYDYEINYKEEYKDYIINDNIKEVSYSIANDTDVMYGKVYISSNNKLYITDELRNRTDLLLDEEVITLYNAFEDFAKCSIYAITKSGDLYHVGVSEPYIKAKFAEKIKLENKVTNFTSLKFNSYNDAIYDSIVVLTDDGNMYDTSSLIIYNPYSLNVFGEYIIHASNEISNFNREFLVNKDGDYYKAKTIITSNNPINDLEGNPKIIIITEDNKLIYTFENKVYECAEDVKKISVENNKIIVQFKPYKIVIDGLYDLNYYPIKNK